MSSLVAAFRSVSVTLSFTLALTACTGEVPATSAPARAAATPEAAASEKCVHGVTKELCGRCNPALKPAFVAKNDWCAEHDRPESQCVVCHPELAKAGVR